MKYSIFSLVFFLLLLSCKESGIKRPSMESKYTINVDDIKKEGVLGLSSIFKSIRPIILETKDNCLIGNIDGMQVFNDLIYILDIRIGRGVFVFDMEGNFVRRIGRIGGGPGEYSSVSDFTFDRENGMIFLIDDESLKINKYKLNGEYVSSISINEMDGRSAHIQYIDKKIYADFESYRTNENIDSCLIKTIDPSNGKVMENWLSVSNNNGWQRIILKGESYFYSRTGSSPKYIPYLSNTVYSVGESIEPYFTLESKDLIRREDFGEVDLMSSDALLKLSEIDKISFLLSYIETENIILFDYRKEWEVFSVIYDIKNNRARVHRSFYDDFTYLSFGESVPLKFACGDDQGMFAYIHTDETTELLSRVKDNKVNPDLPKLEILKYYGTSSAG
ncbi:MAG: 6-bladed beta-propeller [Dysgonomonas sp.]